MKQLFTILLFFASTFAYSQGNSNQVWLQNFLNDQAIINAPVSICVSDLNSQTELLNVKAALCITPASVQKLITSATALEILGKDFHFETTVGYRGYISDSILNGDLIIIGGGDPTLGSDYQFGAHRRDFYAEWVKAIQQLGIDSINGNIIANPSIYTDQDVPQTWIWEDLANYYGASAQGISLYDNTFQLIFSTEDVEDGKTEVIGTNPYIPGLKLKNDVTASSDGRDQSVVLGSPYDSFRIIKGSLPKGKTDYKIRASIPDPALLLAYELKQELELQGIHISGNALKIVSSNRLESKPDSVVLKWPSPPLFEIINELNAFSINLFAEHLCKQLGLAVKGEGSTIAGVKTIKEYWEKRGIDTNFIFMADGSGLSRSNALSAKALVSILTVMNNDSINGTFFKNSIPQTGLQGTQQYYFQNSFLKGKARAKSGSMTRVRSFAGYMTTQKGTPIAFAIIVNNFNTASFDMAAKMEKLLEEIYLNL